MTDAEINKAVAEKLGICWHEGDCAKLSNPYDVRHGQYILFCKHCKLELESDYEKSNPDFCTNAKVLLDELEKRDDCRYFIKHVSSWVVPFKRKEKLFLNIDYVKNPRQLAIEYLRWKK